jgi:hypothetical protein
LRSARRTTVCDAWASPPPGTQVPQLLAATRPIVLGGQETNTTSPVYTEHNQVGRRPKLVYSPVAAGSPKEMALNFAVQCRGVMVRVTMVRISRHGLAPVAVIGVEIRPE